MFIQTQNLFVPPPLQPVGNTGLPIENILWYSLARDKMESSFSFHFIAPIVTDWHVEKRLFCLSLHQELATGEFQERGKLP